MGRGTKRAPRSSKILECRGRATTHYLEGVEGCPSRCREFLTADGRPQRPHARGQPRRRHVLTHLTSQSRGMLEELRRLWCLLHTDNINLRARYFRSAANVWADKLSRHLDNDEWRPYPLLFAELDARFRRHSIDRFA
jgi:hypothetical protein